MTDVNKRMNPLPFGSNVAVIQIWLIQKSRVESQITFAWNFGISLGHYAGETTALGELHLLTAQ